MEAAAHQVVTIGKLQMTLPAAIVAVAGFVIAVAVAWLVHPIMGIAVLPGFFIAAYNVNCVTVGHCTTWAWILTSIYAFYTAILVIVMLSKIPGVLDPSKLSNKNKSPKSSK